MGQSAGPAETAEIGVEGEKVEADERQRSQRHI